MSSTRETVTCFEHQPESWYRTANTLGFDRDFVRVVDPPGVMSNPPGIFAEPEPPYGGRYAHPRPTRVRGEGRAAFERVWAPFAMHARKRP